MDFFGTDGCQRAIILGIFALIPISGTGPGASISGTYEINAGKSEINAILTQEGLIGRLRPFNTVSVAKFTGRVELPPENEANGVAAIEAESASLENNDKNISEIEKREFNRVLHDVILETGKFKSIIFKSTSITGLTREGKTRNFTLNGRLTIRGVTRNVSLPVKVTLSNGQLTATGEGRFRQTDFGITPYSGGFGAIKVGDEVKVTFSIVAKPEGAPPSSRRI